MAVCMAIICRFLSGLRLVSIAAIWSPGMSWSSSTRRSSPSTPGSPPGVVLPRSRLAVRSRSDDLRRGGGGAAPA